MAISFENTGNFSGASTSYTNNGNFLFLTTITADTVAFVSGVTFNGSSLTQIGATTGIGNTYIQTWYLFGATLTTANIVVSGNTNVAGTASSVNGVTFYNNLVDISISDTNAAITLNASQANAYILATFESSGDITADSNTTFISTTNASSGVFRRIVRSKNKITSAISSSVGVTSLAANIKAQGLLIYEDAQSTTSGFFNFL